jgi:deazaflavin-dependent oxidoreductase (nitroreductase family)
VSVENDGMGDRRYVEPGWFTRNLFNRMVAALTRAGVSVWGSRELRVRGRKSGEWRTTPVNLLTFEAEPYLVAPRGETQWVRNLRVAGEGELRVGRRTEAFRATELPDEEKVEVLRAYLKRWKAEVGVFFGGVSATAPDSELRRIASDHPVFRLTITGRQVVRVDLPGGQLKLNAVEKALMNNRVRAELQWRYEAPLLERLGGRVTGGRVLEIGCGRGVGAQIILERFGASTVTAFDVDPDMVEQARTRLGQYGDRVMVSVGDATAIDAADGSFDAVFDFGIIHHVPDWRRAVTEVRRVLVPEGRFYFEEVTSHALDRWSYRQFLEHPEHDRFSATEFVAELERQQLHVGDRWLTRFFGDFVFGVAQRVGAGA